MDSCIFHGGRFGWAIPDPTALCILSHFSPLIELGAGRGYWGHCLRSRGVDILCYDINVKGDKREWEREEWKVRKGSPETKLPKRKHKRRTLFLCYPDDNETGFNLCIID